MLDFSGYIILIFSIIIFIVLNALIINNDYKMSVMLIGFIVFLISALFFYIGLEVVITCEQEKTVIDLLNKEIQVDTLAVTQQGKIVDVKLTDVK